jgi:hypothetical protein
MSFLRVAEQVLRGSKSDSKCGLRDRGGQEQLSADFDYVCLSFREESFCNLVVIDQPTSTKEA